MGRDHQVDDLAIVGGAKLRVANKPIVENRQPGFRGRDAKGALELFALPQGRILNALILDLLESRLRRTHGALNLVGIGLRLECIDVVEHPALPKNATRRRDPLGIIQPLAVEFEISEQGAFELVE